MVTLRCRELGEEEHIRFFTRLFPSRLARTGASIQTFSVGLVILQRAGGLITVSGLYENVILMIAGLNLVGGFLLARTGIITPEIVSLNATIVEDG